MPDPPRSPQPAIVTIQPFLITQSETPVTVTLTGLNFVRRSAVEFKGKHVPIQVVSPTELKFALDAESTKQAGRFDLVVINPAPTDTFFTRGMWGTARRTSRTWW